MKCPRPQALVLLGAAVLACVSTVHPTSALAVAEQASPNGVLFDDFQYDSPDDPRLGAHGWTVRTRAGGPGKGNTWSADAVTFPADASAVDDRVMQLRATTDGTAEGTVKAEVHTTQSKFFVGTYAARVYFTDNPTTGTGEDISVQAFFTISPTDGQHEANHNYSELDYEYLPNGGWHPDSEPRLYNTAWNSTSEDKEHKSSSNAVTSLHGWHTLAMTVERGAVEFYLDGQKRFHPNWRYSAREPMTINVNNWFAELVNPGRPRTWDMKVDWIYHNTGALTAEEITAAVSRYNANGTHFVNTVPMVDAVDGANSLVETFAR